MLLIDEFLLTILAEICIKMRYFYWKIAKVVGALEIYRHVVW